MSDGATMSTPALDQRLLTQHGQCLVIQHIAALVDQAILSVAGVGVQRHVGHHAQLREACLECTHRAGNQSLRVGGQFAVGGFQVGGNDREEGQYRYPQRAALFRHVQQLVDGVAMHARHRADGYRFTCGGAIVVMHEHRVDEVIRAQVRFLQHAPRKVMTPVAAHPGTREGAQGRASGGGKRKSV